MSFELWPNPPASMTAAEVRCELRSTLDAGVAGPLGDTRTKRMVRRAGLADVFLFSDPTHALEQALYPPIEIGQIQTAEDRRRNAPRTLHGGFDPRKFEHAEPWTVEVWQ